MCHRLRDTTGGYGFTNLRPKSLAGVARYDRQRNTPIDAVTQAQLSMHNREIKTCGTTGTSQTLRLKHYSSTLIIEKDSKY